MRNYIEEQQVGDLKVVVVYDEDPLNPREEWDNMTFMPCWHRRNTYGDSFRKDFKFKTPMDWLESLGLENLEEGWNNDRLSEYKDGWIWPLYVYSHSGDTISMSEFGDRWDSGQVGYVSITRKALLEGWPSLKDASEAELRLKALEVCQGDVETYDQYLTGQVYGFQVWDVSELDEDEDPKNGELLDCCYGFFGDSEDCLKEGVSNAEWELKSREKKAAEKAAAELAEKRRIEDLSYAVGRWFQETKEANESRT